MPAKPALEVVKFNILTFDLEEWFHILETGWHADYEKLPSHAGAGMDMFLELLAEAEVSGTIFILGWVAERHPDWVKKIHAAGHDVASHGFNHDLIYEAGPDKFREDIRKAKCLLEDLTGNAVRGYRGPGFSITRENAWAFDIIAEEGYRYDATLYPGNHGHGGIPNLPRTPFMLKTLSGHTLEEFPVTLIGPTDFRFAFAGGGYFRFFPYPFITRVITHLNNNGIPVTTYFHPRDLDPDTPHLPMTRIRRFKCYVNVAGALKKLKKMLKRHTFSSIRDWREGHSADLDRVSLKNFFTDMSPPDSSHTITGEVGHE